MKSAAVALAALVLAAATPARAQHDGQLDGPQEQVEQDWYEDGDTAFDEAGWGELEVLDTHHEPSAAERPRHPLAFAPHDGVWVEPSLSYRLRYYHREGGDFQPGGVRNLLRHRARLGFEVTYRERVGAFVQLQDVRTFGEELDPVGDYDADGLDLHQAYATLSPENWRLRLGRQELSFLNERLIGKLGFAEQARAFDALSLAFSREQAQLDLAWALVREDAAQPDARAPFGKRHLGVLHVGHEALRGLHPHIIAVLEADDRSDLVRLTAGGLIEGKLGRGVIFDYTIEGYYQLGKEDPGLSYHAYLFSMRTRAQADIDSKPYLQLRTTWLSGDEDPNDAVVKTFNAPYPTGHAFHGEMDVFIAFPRDTRERGLRDAGLTLGWTPIRTTWTAALHVFDATTFRPGDLRNHFGWEMDFKARTPIYEPYVSLDMVYAFFDPGELMVERGVSSPLRGDPALEHFAYVTTKVAF